MTSSDRVRELCKERGIPLAKIERECGFANGYLGRLKKALPEDRLRKIAEYLGLSAEFLATGEEPEDYYLTPETAQAAQELFDNPDLRMLFDAARGSRSEDLRMAADMLWRFKKGNNDGSE